MPEKIRAQGRPPAGKDGMAVSRDYARLTLRLAPQTRAKLAAWTMIGGYANTAALLDDIIERGVEALAPDLRREVLSLTKRLTERYRRE